MLELAEVFHSLQGEGPFAGKPAVFIRLSRCLEPYCCWCDTKFAWEEGEKVTADTLVARVQGYPAKLIVITGGEPFLQWEDGLRELEEKLLSEGYAIQYETSGKVVLPETPETFVVCSPKYIKKEWHYHPENTGRVDAFKFVAKDNFDEIEQFVKEYGIAPEKVWIMPMGSEREKQINLMPDIWWFCVKKGFNFSPRLHCLTFNEKRKV